MVATVDSYNLHKLPRPEGNHLVAEPIYKKTTEGGLALPESVVKGDEYEPVRLRVLKVGPGLWNEERQAYKPIPYKRGQIVYPGGPGFKWVIDQREIWLIDAGMIVAIEEK